VLCFLQKALPVGFLSGSDQLDKSDCPHQVPAEPLLDSLSPRSWIAAADRLTDFDAECVLVQWWHPFFAPACWAMSRRFRRHNRGAVVFLCHNVYPHEAPRIPGSAAVLRLMVRMAFSQADGFLVHSKRLAQEVYSLVPDAELERIFHPVHDFCRLGGREASNQVPRLLFFGNIRPYKGLEIFIRALALLKREIRFQAVVAGEFYIDSRPIKELTEQLGLARDVVWSEGYIANEDVARCFGEADLVVLPYLEATQSGVVPLAYGFDLPVIASDVGGLSEIVLDGQTGYLVPPGNPEALARMMFEYLSLAEEKKEDFSRNIREFRKQLSWEQVLEKLFEVTRRAGRHRDKGVKGEQ
jgi:glycosyltransferase involved in cell wall biosynthesis